MEAVEVAAQVAVVGGVVLVVLLLLVVVVGAVAVAVGAVSRQLPLPACSSSERMRRCT